MQLVQMYKFFFLLFRFGVDIERGLTPGRTILFRICNQREVKGTNDSPDG